MIQPSTPKNVPGEGVRFPLVQLNEEIPAVLTLYVEP